MKKKKEQKKSDNYFTKLYLFRQKYACVRSSKTDEPIFCSFCKRTYSEGYAFLIEGSITCLCKRCKGKVKPPVRKTRIIYTPMGGKVK